MKRIVVTGAFSNIGAAVAAEVLARGDHVHTLTRRRPREPRERVSVADLRFEREHLCRELEGADALVNTYWIRLPMAGRTFEGAVDNGRLLFEAAAAAGVRRVVHVSVSNPSKGMNLGYYRGKAHTEEALKSTGLSHAILRPTLVLSERDVLTNNIVWLMRRFPFFFVPGGGHARLRPILLADAGRAIAEATLGTDDGTRDLAGPEVFTFREYLETLAGAAGLHPWLLPAPDWLSLLATRVVGWVLSDVVLSREELLGLQQELLHSEEEPLGTGSVREWLEANGAGLGRRYVNDRRLHYGEGRHDPIA